MAPAALLATNSLIRFTMPGSGGSFSDVVSGPRALNFSSDGRYAFIVDTGSEDILVVDANAQVEAASSPI